VHNENSNHNPAEHMEIDDFLGGTAVMTAWLQKQLA
jgi:acetylornithine deacetylase/succinyl-diaminopimelate desuccinylase-like protein